MNRNPLSSLLIAASLLAVSSFAAADDYEARRLVLEHCADREIAAERVRERPSADRVLEACGAELRAFEALLPPDLAAAARRHLKHLIRHRLE